MRQLNYRQPETVDALYHLEEALEIHGLGDVTVCMGVIALLDVRFRSISSICTSFRQGEAEVRAFVGLRLDPDSAAQALHDFFADSQSDPGALKLFSPVQTLENDEDSFKVF